MHIDQAEIILNQWLLEIADHFSLPRLQLNNKFCTLSVDTTSIVIVLKDNAQQIGLSAYLDFEVNSMNMAHLKTLLSWNYEAKHLNGAKIGMARQANQLTLSINFDISLLNANLLLNVIQNFYSTLMHTNTLMQQELAQTPQHSSFNSAVSATNDLIKV